MSQTHSHYVYKKYGHNQLVTDTIEIKLHGSAGQSLGAFLTKGMLDGDFATEVASLAIGISLLAAIVGDLPEEVEASLEAPPLRQALAVGI